MILISGLALAFLSPVQLPVEGVQPPDEEQVCREVMKRSELTFFHSRKRKICKTAEQWAAYDEERARAGDRNFIEVKRTAHSLR